MLHQTILQIAHLIKSRYPNNETARGSEFPNKLDTCDPKNRCPHRLLKYHPPPIHPPKNGLPPLHLNPPHPNPRNNPLPNPHPLAPLLPRSHVLPPPPRRRRPLLAAPLVQHLRRRHGGRLVLEHLRPERQRPRRRQPSGAGQRRQARDPPHYEAEAAAVRRGQAGVYGAAVFG